MLAAHGLFYFAPCDIVKSITFVAVASFCTYQAWFYTRPWLLDAARVLSRTGFFIAQKPCAVSCAVYLHIALEAPQSGRFFIFKKK